jgi:hypothetical protein
MQKYSHQRHSGKKLQVSGLMMPLPIQVLKQATTLTQLNLRVRLLLSLFVTLEEQQMFCSGLMPPKLENLPTQ